MRKRWLGVVMAAALLLGLAGTALAEFPPTSPNVMAWGMDNWSEEIPAYLAEQNPGFPPEDFPPSGLPPADFPPDTAGYHAQFQDAMRQYIHDNYKSFQEGDGSALGLPSVDDPQAAALHDALFGADPTTPPAVSGPTATQTLTVTVPSVSSISADLANVAFDFSDQDVKDNTTSKTDIAGGKLSYSTTADAKTISAKIAATQGNANAATTFALKDDSGSDVQLSATDSTIKAIASAGSGDFTLTYGMNLNGAPKSTGANGDTYTVTFTISQ